MLPIVIRLFNQYRNRYPVLTEFFVAGVLVAFVIIFTATFSNRVWVPASRNGIIVPTLFESATAWLNGQARVYWGCAGFIFGLGLTWLSDDVKRYQIIGPLALLLTAIVSIGISPLSFVPEGGIGSPVSGILLFVWFSLTLAAGLVAGGIPLPQRLINQKVLLSPNPPYHFRLASITTIALVGAAVVIGLLDVHVFSDPSNLSIELQNREMLVTNAVLGTIVVGMVIPFTTYSSNLKIIQLGPARSGKSAMFGGLAVKLKEDGRLFTGEGERSPEIIDAMNKLQAGQQRQFPDVTKRDEVDVFRFSYVSGDLIFRTKTTVSAVDYGGELLTGGPNSQSLDEEIQERIDSDEESHYHRTDPITKRIFGWIQVQLSQVFSRTDWDLTIESIMNKDDPSSSNIRSELAKLVIAADMIVFTLPMDDYLHKSVERSLQKKDDRTPSYLDIKIYPDKDQEVNASSSDEESVEVEPNGKPLTEEIQQDMGESSSNSGADTRVSVENLERLPRTRKPRKRFVVGQQEGIRRAPEEYQNIYMNIVDTFRDRLTKRYTWVTTKTDLILKDFERTRDNLVDDYSRDPLFNKNDMSNQIARKRGSLDWHTSKESKLRMQVLSRWVLRQHIQRVFPQLTKDGYLNDTYQNFVYPVWFNVEEGPDNELRPKSEGNIFAGWEYILDRYDGKDLVEPGIFDNSTSLIEEEYQKLVDQLRDNNN